MLSYIKTKPSNLIFYISYTLIIVSYMFSNVYAISPICNTLKKIAMLGLIFTILLQSKKYTKKEIWLIYCITVVIGISYLISRDSTILIAWLAIVAAKNINFKKFIKYDFILRVCFIIIVVALYYVGLTENYFMSRAGNMVRSSMGFAHPNDFGGYILIVCLDIVYLKKDNMKFIHYAILIISSMVIKYFADSRTSQLAIIMLAILVALIKITKGKIFINKMLHLPIKHIFVILTILTILLAFAYKEGNSMAIKINDLLSGRIMLSSEAFERYDINVFGNDIEFINTKEASENKIEIFILDNSYVNILFVYGVFTYIIIVCAAYCMNKKILREKQYVLLAIFLVMYIYGFSETGLFNIKFNSFLIYLSYLLYKKNEAKRKGKANLYE